MPSIHRNVRMASKTLRLTISLIILEQDSVSSSSTSSSSSPSSSSSFFLLFILDRVGRMNFFFILLQKKEKKKRRYQLQATVGTNNRQSHQTTIICACVRISIMYVFLVLLLSPLTLISKIGRRIEGERERERNDKKVSKFLPVTSNGMGMFH